jgi:cytochrome oxidase Cu insertion factor (SCO1/SenC/PrrC family)
VSAAVTEVPPPPADAPPPRRGGWLLVLGVALVLGSSIGAAAGVLVWRHAKSTSLPAACASIGCNDLGGPVAPPVALTDQAGHRVSLGDLRGKVVVLSFMDPVCVDICPIVSDEFLRAQHDLGAAGGSVVFVGVNVNQAHESTGSVMGFSREHQLTTLPHWHFLTGTTAELQQVWKDYRIGVFAQPGGEVVHTSILYFIDPAGHLRIGAYPAHSSATIDSWGDGIAQVVRWLQG